MARKKRIWYPGAMYHVMSRGNRKMAIFEDEEDYAFFLKTMIAVKKKYPFTIHGICLMTNHFHLSIETGEVELWKIMQSLLSLYAEWYNHRHHYTGHVFEGRYTSCMIEDRAYFLEVSRYIHLNPVKAQLVQDPLAYEYSSYGVFMEGIKDEKYRVKRTKCRTLIEILTDTSRVLSCFGFNAREQYRVFVEGEVSHADPPKGSDPMNKL